MVRPKAEEKAKEGNDAERRGYLGDKETISLCVCEREREREGTNYEKEKTTEIKKKVRK